MLAAIPVWFFYRPAVSFCILLMIPLVMDGIIQLRTSYESTNLRRVLTGLLYGYSLTSLFIISSIAAYRFGFQLVQ